MTHTARKRQDEKRTVTISVVSALLCVAFSAPANDLQTFLRVNMRFSEAEAARVERGEATVKVLPARDRREIAVFGAVRIAASDETFLALARDIAAFKKSSMVLQVGRISAGPQRDDFAALTLAPEDVEALRACKVGDCGIRLAAADIERFRTEIAWAAPGARVSAEALFRDVLYRRASAYWTGGMEALAPYRDHESVSLSPAAEFAALLQAPQYFFDGGAELPTYLDRFPQERADHVEDFLYWSKEQFGLKPVVSVTHMSVHRHAGATPPITIVASKQIYASHYFDASLGVTTIVPQPGPQQGFYLLYLNRSRTDSLRGVFRSFLRSTVQRRTREGMERTLASLKARLERS